MAKGIIQSRKITEEEARHCAAEAIQHIGSIQSHGFQLVLESNSLMVVQHSENFIQLLNQYNTPDKQITPKRQILNTAIDEWLSFSDPRFIESLKFNRTTKLDIENEKVIVGDMWECIAHKTEQWISLEFIPTSKDLDNSFALITQMSSMIEMIREAKGTQEVFDTITSQFQAYTKFDRVMLYRFLPDWSGEVVAEAVSERFSPEYLYLRFPADDIPEQARKLYSLNKVRVFANVDEESSPLIPQKLPDGKHLNQSYSLLRSMSNMHRIYLQNMGVKATLSLSIIVDNKLWGLVVFHHSKPKTPPNHVVAQLKLTCELFCEIISSYLMPSIQMSQITYLMTIKSCIEKTFNDAKMSPITDELFENSLRKINEIANYDYLGIIYGDRCYALSEGEFVLLSEKTISAINKLFSVDKNRFQSYELHRDFGPIPGLEKMIGVYALRSVIPSDFYVFLGRKEIIKNIMWGGVPNTVNIVINDNKRQLEPRSSFAFWREQVKGQSEFWTEKDTKTIEHLFTNCKDFTIIKSNELMMKQLERHAHFDPLTELANRTYLKTFIESIDANSDKKYISLLFIDLDDFKDVNDFMGHETGDRLLITVANRLKACCRPDDLVVRLGGDEFVIVLTHEKEQAMGELADKVVKRISKPVIDNEHTIVITPSVGVISCDIDKVDFHEMLKRADIAMYSAKNKGKSAYHIFDNKDQDAFNKKAILTMDLRDYINAGEIELHFQAQCDYSKNLTGAETLARWNHPKFGYINPETFIQIAEMNNLIKPLSLIIFEQACEQLVLWKKRGIPEYFETLSINISPSLLLEDVFIHEILDIVGQYEELDPHDIRLEITESIFMHSQELAITNLNLLRDKGFSISLDDFGTGYSSLNYLWKLPIDEVKIDKSFISNMSKDSGLFKMVESIIDLCKKLEMEVVAEGVESHVEYTLLKGLVCDTCQGYFYSKPMLSKDFIETYITYAN